MWHSDDDRDEWAMRVIGAWLRAWRHSVGVTQRQLARLAAVDQSHICRIEQGKRRPSGIPMARLVIVLDWLSTGEGRGGPWGRIDAPLPTKPARWGPGGRPPAVLGREPLPSPAAGDPLDRLSALLGLPPEPPAAAPAADDATSWAAPHRRGSAGSAARTSLRRKPA